MPSTTSSRNKTDSQPAGRIALHIEGMHCGSCVARVEAALRSVDGAHHASVNLATQTAVVTASERGAADMLVEAVRRVGYDARPQRDDQLASLTALQTAQTGTLREQRQALVVAIGMALPVIALDHVGPHLQSGHAGGFVWWRVLQATLTTLLLLSPAGGPILASGLRALLHGAPNMDSLIGIGVVAAFLAGLFDIPLAQVHSENFHTAAMILAFINVGKYLETRARR